MTVYSVGSVLPVGLDSLAASRNALRAATKFVRASLKWEWTDWTPVRKVWATSLGVSVASSSDNLDLAAAISVSARPMCLSASVKADSIAETLTPRLVDNWAARERILAT